jgi:hypothetical protein
VRGAEISSPSGPMSHERTSFSSGRRGRAVVVFRSSLVAAIALGSALASAAVRTHQPLPVADDEALASNAPANVAVESAARVDFQRDVRPILAGSCFACHGPDAATRKAELRLDTRDGLFGDRGGWSAFVPGDVDKSEAFLRITDHFDPMPPSEFQERVDEDEQAVLRTWIEQGAAWSGHWAFEPVARPELPQVRNADRVTNAIDAFVFARIEEAGLEPSREADRASLLRRVTFDLTGLPPTAAEIDAFIADAAPDAYEKVVDRLLASPAYGERQAQEWLDLSRYADSQGDGKDGPRDMWKWREWVIESFNENKPYDQFVIEQLAGDLLPDATLDQKIATGFNRNHFIYSKFGAEKDEYRTAYVVDRVNTTSTVFLGLTMACAQCHDHKYDPITHEDYYKLFAFFNNVAETDVGSGFGNSQPRLVVAEGESATRLAQIDARVEELETYFEAEDSELDAAQAEWEAERVAARANVAWTQLEVGGLLSQNGAHLRALEDGSILASGPNPSSDVYHLVAQPGARTIVAFKIEALPHETLPDARSGRSMDGTFSLAEFEVHVRSILEGDEGQRLQFIVGEGTHASSGRSSVDSAADGEDRGGWSVPKNFAHEPQEAIFVLEEPLVLRDADVMRLTLNQPSSFQYNNTLGRFRISFTADEAFVRERLPLVPSVWRAVGPFAGEDPAAAFAEVFEPEKLIAPDAELDFEAKYEPIDLKKRAKEKKEAEKKAAEEAKKSAEAGDATAAPAARGEGAAADAAAGRGAERTAAVARRLMTALEPVQRAVEGRAPIARAARAIERTLESVVEEAAQRAARAPALEPAADVPTAPADEPAADVPTAPAERVVVAAVVSDEPVAVEAPVQRAPVASAPMPETPAVPADAKSDAPAAVMPVEKPADTPAEKPEPEAEAEGGGFGFGGARRGEEREGKLTWEEKRDWRLSGSLRLTGRSSAWYLHRTFAPTEARDVVLRHDGFDALKIWIDGALVFEKAPEPPAEGAEEEEKSGPGGGGDEENEEEFDFESFQREGVQEFESFAFRLEPGEHDFVVKAVTGRTGSRGTLQFLALGRDVVPYEVAHAIEERDADAGAIASGAVSTTKADEISDFSFGDDGDDGQASTHERRRTWVREWYRRQVSDEGRPLWDELTELRQEKSALERQLPSVMVMADREEPRETHVLLRGNYNAKAQRVYAGVPSVLPPLPEGASNDRIGLAQWIASEANPLTARVAVNRYWQQYFGRAIVTTPGDFGTRGSLPTHPELLDWLASEYVANGWDTKAMHRLIVTSSTYRQSSRITTQHLEVDPDNTLLARAPRGRLSAEQVRDNALAVAGLLSNDVGGKSVKPYQPKGLWEAQGAFQSYKQDKGDKLYRRGIYVYWKRSTLYPSFEAFDAPTRLTCVVERAKTTTPLQSLVLLNDPVYVEAARFLGQRMLLEGGKDVSTRLVFGFRLCTSRLPTDEELGILLRIHAEQKALFDGDEKAAKELIAVGDKKPDESLAIGDLATWTVMGSVLLNLDATIHKR